MKTLTLGMILIAHICVAQTGTVAQFAIWKPKAGQEENFEVGYKKHLDWHKTNGDTWSWYGWYIISGPRYGLFVDATFDHAWSDFNNSVKPAGDRADNQLHVVPFADLQTVFKVVRESKTTTTDSLKRIAKFQRLITLTVNDVAMGLKVAEELKRRYTQMPAIQSFETYKVTDGGTVNELLIFIGVGSYSSYQSLENLPQDIAAIENTFKTKTITGITVESLLLLPEMSIITGN